MELLNRQIETYIRRHTTRESELLQHIVKETEAELDYSDMISGGQVGQFIKLLVRFGKCKRVLEIGTFTGYSAVWIADALPEDGELITLEMNLRYKSISNKFLSREPYRNKIRQIDGPALESIEKLNGMFDLVFLDADKVHYPDYYRVVKPKLKSGGVLVTDNTLWGGSVLAPDDAKSRAVDRMNRLIQEDADFENVLLPVRDGVSVALKL
ncbi:MAG: class I SAM-dependent methyltransferase [Balneolaceae bacterium]